MITGSFDEMFLCASTIWNSICTSIFHFQVHFLFTITVIWIASALLSPYVSPCGICLQCKFWLQMSEPITHIDTDNYMTIHHKGTSFFDSTAHLMCFVYFLLIGLENVLHHQQYFGFIATSQLIFCVALFLTLCMCCVVFPDHNHSSRWLFVVC